MRVLFILLVAFNAFYLAWAGWIDVPPRPPLFEQKSMGLRELVLAAPRPRGAELSTPVTPNAPAAQTVADTAPADEPTEPLVAATRCVSVGPFPDLARAARSAALLKDRGFNPRQRAAAGELWEGFWVYVGGLDSQADEARLVKTLARAGISDAQPMPNSDEGYRVSLGLFTEKVRAERRAAAVKKLGYTADIVDRKQPATEYWVDMDLAASDRTVPTEGLLSGEDAGERLEIRVCPTEPATPRPTPLPRDALPAATTADAGLPRPG